MSDQDLPNNVHPSIGTRSKSGDLFSSSSISPSTSSSSHGSAKTAVSECLGAWLNYLQILNSLCSSGHRLAQTISTLEQLGQCEQQTHGFQIPSIPQQPVSSQVSTQFVTAWDDLARATAVATSTVKSHIVSVLQDYVVTSLVSFDQDSEKVREHNQNIVMETAQTMINIQHQFCVASYDSFSSLMCCFICQTPVGFPHDSECTLLQQQPHFQRNQNAMGDPRSQTPSPHFGSLTMNFPKNERDIYRMSADSHPTTRQMFGSGSSQASDHNCAMTEIRGPSPSFLENIRGPLPNPGHLLGMKTPFNRGGRSPLNFPLFPLNGQRRWSEAAAGEVKGESVFDAESHMRRWSMPWEASTSVKNTVTWHQTKIMPISKLAVPTSKSNSQSTTPDSMWQSSIN
ncbi:hypothetical protein HA402_009250 [Bradysia odoriphaga]|nr:hypothetical protein HA402_009250 [Bradysia odoriphaga]